MGVSISLTPVDEIPKGTEQCGKAFYEEIISAVYPDYLKHEEFLSEEEINELSPEYDDGKSTFRPRDPLALKNVLVKVSSFLHEQHDRFQLVHWIFETQDKTSGSTRSKEFEYKGFRCYLNGSHEDINHRQEMQLYRWKNGWEFFEWVEAKLETALDSHKFYITTENKHERFRANLTELIEICDQAILANKKLIWTFSN
jgi:hypothetical protein